MNRKTGSAITDLEIVNQFAISLLRQDTLDDLLWSMAANLGEVLGFEDCVIYLLEGELLVQKAAYGVKNPASRDIKNEISIPLGKGIVGAVAQHGRSENVGDLSDDPRYIHDEVSGRSELAVPLIADGRVIGVLDSESSALDGFDAHDTEMLESLANIAAPRIASALARRDQERAEQAVREAALADERANRAKSAFLSRMSHELKTPLHAILGFAELIKLDDGANCDPRIDKILFSGKHLLKLIDESLDLVRVEQNAIALDIRPVKVDEVIAECLAMLQPNAAKFRVRLRAVGGGPLLDTDRQRLRQVLLNLVSNAIKYNREHGEVVVSASEDGETGVEIAVEDTGIGMSRDELSRLYRPFTRFGERQGSVDGHGMGMAISRQLVEAMGGQIHASSAPGKGTRVSITLPCQRRQSVA